MTTSMPRCRGFSHPFLLVVRNTLKTTTKTPTATRNSPWLLRTVFPRQQQNAFSSARSLFNNKPPAANVADQVQANARLSFAQRLAMKPRPTTLYEGPPQKAFLISSYAAATMCFGSAFINGWLNVANLPEGVSQWVGVGFGVISIIFSALGTTFALRPASIIRAIKVLPSAASQGGTPQRVMLEVTVRRRALIPLPPKRIQVTPEQIVMANRMCLRPVILSQEEIATKKMEDTKRRQAEREYELNHLMTAPFRDARKAGFTLFENIQRGLTGEGFAPIYIKGEMYKVDVLGGYALEGGQVLDRIVRITPNPKLAAIQSAEAK